MTTTLAIIALVISLASAAFTGRLAFIEHDRRQEEKADRAVSTKAAKNADVRATFNGRQVIVVNHGPATARNLTTELRPVDGAVGNAPHWLGEVDATPEMRAGAYMRAEVAIDFETAEAFVAVVTFTDDAGTRTERFPMHLGNPTG